MTAQKLVVLPKEIRLAAARSKAYEKMPYFRSGIQSLVPHEMPGLGSLGVTAASVLAVDYEALGEWTAAEAAAVLIHEYLHIYMRHHARSEELFRKGMAQQGDEYLVNVAQDCEINDNLVAANLKLPGDFHLPTKYDLPPDRTSEEYFIAMKKRRDENPDDPRNPKPPDKPGWGWCGSGSAKPLPNEPTEAQAPGRTPVEQEVRRRSDSEQIVQAAKGQGSVPAGLARQAGVDLTEPKISWERLLEHRLGRSVTRKAGEVDYTFDERSRMQSAMDLLWEDDAPIVPGLDAPTVNIALVIDTSGSMGDAEIDAFRSEVQGIIKAQSGATLSLIVCDAEVHASCEVRTVAEIGKHLAGGGGTDFRPAFAELARLKTKPDIAIFGTDGYGAYPDAPPKGIDVIWLNTGGRIGVDWGTVIDVDVKQPDDDDD